MWTRYEKGLLSLSTTLVWVWLATILIDFTGYLPLRISFASRSTLAYFLVELPLLSNLNITKYSFDFSDFDTVFS